MIDTLVKRATINKNRKPIVEIKDREVKSVGAARTTKQNEERILNFLLKFGEIERLAVLHANAETCVKNIYNAKP